MKRTNLLFLLTILFSLVGCEKEPESPLIPTDSSKKFSAFFDQKATELLIPFNYTVDWDNPLVGYSDDLSSDFYEFPVQWENGNNPNTLSPSRKALGIRLEYRIVAVPNGNSFDFYVARFEGDSIGREREISLTLLNRFHGIYWLYGPQETITIKQYDNGNYSGVLLFDENPQQSLTEKNATCDNITYEIRTDYYNVRGDGSLDYNGSSTEYRSVQVCSGGSGGLQQGSSGPTLEREPKNRNNNGSPTRVIVKEVLLKDDRNLEDQIINNLTGKAKCVYEKLEETSSGFVNAIKKFDGDFPVAHLEYSMDYNLPSSISAVTNNSGQYLIEIKLNGNNLNQRTILGLARTLAHETIHAELYRKVRSVGGKISINDFPGIYDYYRRYIKNWQHQQMAAHYKESIADILHSFDNNQHSRQFYMDLAWEGLHGTVAWDNLSSLERARITKVITNHKLTGDKNCN